MIVSAVAWLPRLRRVALISSFEIESGETPKYCIDISYVQYYLRATGQLNISNGDYGVGPGKCPDLVKTAS